MQAPNETSSPQSDDAPSPPTDEECLEFANRLHSDVMQRDVVAFKDRFDWKLLGERITAGIDAPREYRDLFMKSAGQGNGSTTFCQSVIDAVSDSGSYRLMKVHTVDNERRLLFRLLSASGRVNYHDYVLTRKPNHEVAVVDVHIFLVGESVSELIRRSYVQGLADRANGRLSGTDDESARSILTIVGMSNDLREGHFQGVLNKYAMLPTSAKREKAALLLRLISASHLSDEEYSQAVDSFRNFFPQDASLPLNALGYYVIHDQHAKAFECVDHIEAIVGHDPFLNVLRSQIAGSQKQFDVARNFATKAVTVEPELFEAHWELLLISLDQKRFDDTARILTLLSDDFQLSFDDLANDTLFSEFVKSRSYQDWLKSPKD